MTVVVTTNSIGGSVRFYQNGVFNASATLPRDITSCVGPIVVADVRSSFSRLSLLCVHLPPFLRSLCVWPHAATAVHFVSSTQLCRN
jgi:hypothetical protein